MEYVQLKLRVVCVNRCGPLNFLGYLEFK